MHTADGRITFARLIGLLDPEPEREGLRDTPARMSKAWEHWTSGYAMDLKTIARSFEDGGENYNEMVMVTDIPVYSHCEHHLAPFFGVAHVGYIPNGRILGLSKIARIVDMYALRLQVQERMTNQIADAMVEVTSPQGVAVVVKCRHLCMESRGIRRTGTTTTTSAMRGALMDDATARAEFLSLIRGDTT